MVCPVAFSLPALLSHCRCKLVKAFKSKRFGRFVFFLASAAVFYLVDCLVSHSEYPELPWFETGIYAGGPLGFVVTVLFALAAFWHLVFGKNK